jgi:hypothetical protein
MLAGTGAICTSWRPAESARPRAPEPELHTGNPEGRVLDHVVQQHLEPLLSEAVQAEDGASLSKFVDKELRAFLKCVVLGARLFSVPLHRLQAPSASCCSAARAADLPELRRQTHDVIAAHLTDQVVPYVPVRQFVLSPPYCLRCAGAR